MPSLHCPRPSAASSTRNIRLRMLSPALAALAAGPLLLSSQCARLARGSSRSLPGILGLLVVLGMTVVAPAGVIITIEESGSDVVATLSGAINDFTGATLFTTQPDNFSSFLRPDASTAAFGPGGLQNYDIYQIAAVPPDFGTTGTLAASSSTGTSQFFVRNNPSSALFLQAGYTAGTALSGTATYANQSFTSLGITPGTYAYTWTGDSITINVVPEPSTYAMALAGIACGGYLVRRRRKRA